MGELLETNYKQSQIERPNWDDYFLGLAFVISARSRDEHTQHGAVIVDAHNRILGTGYNGFVQGIDDKQLPISRPAKYSYMIHAEENALLNCTRSPRENKGSKLYTTGQPCNNCFQRAIQAGIEIFVVAKRQGTQLENSETRKSFELLKRLSGVKVKYKDINVNWAYRQLFKVTEDN